MAAQSYARGETHPALLETTIGANLAATAARFPQRAALVDVAAGRRWSYAELRADVRRFGDRAGARRDRTR
ncbi:hypothetical protein C1Y40_03468 [Mycobacterium talmoniae]|uniref:Uncharacterized protein n=1 Tax=Mycobacterium talmoniae TaxID=1858794 RepID=A0A2S8BI71_9MYCO|nr:hypothetical protein C1Y40_03468 [Mycobacterium talmoniae]